MRFDRAGSCYETVWQMRLAEQPRAENRTVLNRLFNGEPPFDQATAEENGVQINYNSLEGPNLLSQARRQWNNAFLKPGNYFTVMLDSGPAHKRRERSRIITNNLNRCLKRTPEYMELLRALGANTILHGLAPANWPDSSNPFARPLLVGDLLVPSETLIDFHNLDHFAVYRQLSPAELYELTHGPKVDPGWNMAMVKNQLQYAAEATTKMAYSVAYQYQPERVEELIKQDLGFWGSDAPPTIDVWDFYFREAEDGEGWYRRVLLDASLAGESGQAPPIKGKEAKDGDWLYTSGKRKYANSVREILHCQFGDTSAVAPFRYHSVRSLGYMLFGVCEIQNRLRCKFSESVFEQMMWFFRTSGPEQFKRLKKALFSHMGVIPEGISFVSAQERFKPDAALVQLQLDQNRQLMGENAASFTQDFEQGAKSREMTATETIARVNSVNALVSGMLNLAYTYETYQYRETARRFCLKHSKHQIVKKFRLACLKEGVPEEYLDVDLWDIQPERVLGGGNRTLEVAEAQQLITMRPFLGPQAQQTVDHIAVEAFTDDPALAEQLVPLETREQLSTAKHDAMLSVGTIMNGGIVQFPEGHARRDLIETLLIELGTIIQRIQQTGMPTVQELMGLQNFLVHIGQLIQQVGGDKSEGQRAKQYTKALEELAGQVQLFAQAVAQQQQQAMQQNGNGSGGLSAEDIGKIRADEIKARQKAESSSVAHSQKTAQRQITFEKKMEQEQQQHEIDLKRQAEENAVEQARTAMELQGKALETAQNIRLKGLESRAKPDAQSE